MSDWFSLRHLKSSGEIGRTRTRCQISEIREKVTRNGKPYYDLVLRDAEDSATLKVWSDNPAFAAVSAMRRGEFVEVEGEWSTGDYGLECRDWNVRRLEAREAAAVLAGSEDLRARQAKDGEDIDEFVASMRDPRLRTLCRWFLDEFGERFRRTAAARDYHHARRGGLVEHVAQMMRSADALCSVYPAVNRDLVLAGVLFHDAGKLWENTFGENDFTMRYHEAGELMGHITIGMELINRLWRDLMENEEAEVWRELEPSNERVRLHLLHLVASHHGELAFGAPVTPRTPEAMLLHFVDNIDAKLEMMFRGYETSPELDHNVLERVRPLPGRLVRPLEHLHFVDPADEEEAAGKSSGTDEEEPTPGGK